MRLKFVTLDTFLRDLWLKQIVSRTDRQNLMYRMVKIRHQIHPSINTDNNRTTGNTKPFQRKKKKYENRNTRSKVMVEHPLLYLYVSSNCMIFPPLKSVKKDYFHNSTLINQNKIK